MQVPFLFRTMLKKKTENIPPSSANIIFLILLIFGVFSLMFSFLDENRKATKNLFPTLIKFKNFEDTSNKTSSHESKLKPNAADNRKLHSNSSSHLNLNPVDAGQSKDGTSYDAKTKMSKLILFFEHVPLMRKMIGCPYKCEFTNDSARFDESDAVVFIAHSNPSVPNRTRPHGQPWVFLNIESPANFRIDFHKWKSLFNWTMTYRLDSDIVLLYHEVKRSESKGFIPSNKTKQVNWVASNCRSSSKRNEFVKILQNYVDIDIYGKCGTLKVPCKGSSDRKCWTEIFYKYRFYLSFENSFCRDYITEKPFNPLHYAIVPVVRGGAFYQKYFPAKSYINAGDYSTIYQLSENLNRLLQNENEYNSYFDWRKHYLARPCCYHASYCELCRRLYHINSYHSQYENVHDWWHTAGNCRTIEHLNQ